MNAQYLTPTLFPILLSTEYRKLYTTFKLEHVIAQRQKSHNNMVHFMLHFGPALVGVSQWKQGMSAHTNFSDLMSPSDETFLIITLENNLAKWAYLESHPVRIDRPLYHCHYTRELLVVLYYYRFSCLCFFN